MGIFFVNQYAYEIINLDNQNDVEMTTPNAEKRHTPFCRSIEDGFNGDAVGDTIQMAIFDEKSNRTEGMKRVKIETGHVCINGTFGVAKMSIDTAMWLNVYLTFIFMRKTYTPNKLKVVN